jgi:hypothetical protein
MLCGTRSLKICNFVKVTFLLNAKRGGHSYITFSFLLDGSN